MGKKQDETEKENQQQSSCLAHDQSKQSVLLGLPLERNVHGEERRGDTIQEKETWKTTRKRFGVGKTNH